MIEFSQIRGTLRLAGAEEPRRTAPAGQERRSQAAAPKPRPHGRPIAELRAELAALEAASGAGLTERTQREVREATAAAAEQERRARLAQEREIARRIGLL
jgi:hypothetical protein